MPIIVYAVLLARFLEHFNFEMLSERAADAREACHFILFLLLVILSHLCMLWKGIQLFKGKML